MKKLFKKSEFSRIIYELETAGRYTTLARRSRIQVKTQLAKKVSS
jgi:hypothetical protein